MAKTGEPPKKAGRKAAAKKKAKGKASAKKASKASSTRASQKAARPAKAKRASASSGASKSGKLYYRIGEVAKLTGVKPHVLRYWETEFRWMAPPKSRSKQRLYRQKDIEMVQAIKHLLYEERYTIAGARLQLRELGIANLPQVAEEIEEPVEEAAPDLDVDALRAQYKQIRGDLIEIRDLL
ncbi:MAG: MerR family transcriptional regulator [Myxococcota bacterium]|nr:MerR family transcriptional regulator [Myxococcota bacterium]